MLLLMLLLRLMLLLWLDAQTTDSTDATTAAIDIPAEAVAAASVEDLSAYTFAKYAATYFGGHQSHQFSKRPLKTSLLEMSRTIDEIAAQAIWVTLQRFMGDMAEAKFEDESPARTAPIMQTLNTSLSRASTKTALGADLPSDASAAERAAQYKLIQRTLKRKTKLPEQLRQLNELDGHLAFYQQWLSTRSSNLKKIHFIIGHGILRADLRDEIFCQICKQLTDNPNHTSYATGWIMMSLCIGCFPPSERFERYLRAFVRGGPQLYVQYCEYRLDRTLRNGARTQPPSWLELRTSRTKAPIALSITLMDESVHSVEVDSASTAQEVVQQVSTRIGIEDPFGFSVFVKIYDKVMSLGCGREHIMDAISKCEQYAKELHGGSERDAPWKLFFRKEMFAPWHNPATDPVATELIYRQVVHGVHVGEYQCKSDRDIAMLGALYVYAECGAEVGDQLGHHLADIVPRALWQSANAERKWTQLVREAMARSRHVRERMPRGRAKEDVVVFAQLNWTMMLSRFFETVKTGGPELGTNNVIVGVNWTGVFFISEEEQTLLHLTFLEIVSISRNELDPIDELLISTVQNDEFVFKCFDAAEIVALVNHIIQTMRKNSVYAVALQPYTNPELLDTYLELRKGDLITLEAGYNGDVLLHPETTWARGECGGRTGEFPTDVVYVLPCITQPPAEVLSWFTMGAVKARKHAAPNYNTLQRKRMHTLRRYAAEHFRENTDAGRRVVSSMATVRGGVEELWKHTRDPIKRPLLQRLQGEREAFEAAVIMFSAILRYMGDMPRGAAPVDTDTIFRPALTDDDVRDELYCQLMKQLTENRVLISEERGWELLWLATGLAVPSPALHKELNEFLRTRSNPLAAVCAQRLHKTQHLGRREHPPYAVEVEAVRYRTMQIYHRVYFPDDTDEAFEIESGTRARHLCDTIAERLELKSTDGFSLFVRIVDKAFSVPEDKFIFDFIYELVAWWRETFPNRVGAGDQQSQCNYQLFFMKKLWINMAPGRDPNADTMFYFPQEVPKYLNGYYRVPKADAVRIAALLYRVQFGHDSVPLQRQTHAVLAQVLPEDVMNATRPDEWRKLILAMYNSQIDLSENDAKLAFLKTVQEYPTFGSTFFVVKQTTDINLPETILVAINRHGFNIIDPQRRNILIAYGFDQLNVWSSGNTYFHVRFGNMMGGSKLLCETTQGYKMDDLLSSYIRYMRAHPPQMMPGGTR